MESFERQAGSVTGDSARLDELLSREELERGLGMWWLDFGYTEKQRLKDEEEFYRYDVLPPAMEAAVSALEKHVLDKGMLKLVQKENMELKKPNLDPGLNQQIQTADQQKQIDFSIMEKVLLTGDLSKMEPKDRINYYMRTCESLGMNPMTKPFDLITLNGKMILYPNRSGTDQLRRIGNVDTQVVSKEFNKDTGCFVVVAQAKLPNNRRDEDMGVVYCAGLKGDFLANAQMKAMTKAKRRVTLSIMGLGWIDESEVSSVKGATTHKMDLETGAVTDDVVKETNNQAQAMEQKPSKGQITRLYAIAKKAQVSSPEMIREILKEKFNVDVKSVTDITIRQYDDICDYLEFEHVPPAIKPVEAPKMQDQLIPEKPTTSWEEDLENDANEDMAFMK